MSIYIDPSSSIDMKAYFKSMSAKTADAGKSSAAPQSERVEISNTSNELNMVKAAVDALPDVRLDKVEEIRKDIKMNNYPIENNLDAMLKKLLEKNVLP